MPTALLLLTVVTAYLLYRIGRDVLAGNRHLEDDELHAYHSGHLAREDRAEYRRISEHLAHCAACRDRFDRIVISAKGQSGNYLERKF